MKKNRTRLNLHQLENRVTPASVSFYNQNLTIVGDNVASTITVEQTSAAGMFKVTATGLSGTPSGLVTGNISITGGNSADNITVDFKTNTTFGGNVSVLSSGNSGDTINVKNGTMGGRLAVNTGFGNDTVSITAMTVQGI